MYKELISGISKALFQEFGKEFHYYAVQIPQGMKKPCFFILPVQQTERKEIGIRYRNKHTFAIHYFPKETETGLELQEIAERVFYCLEIIEVEEGKIRGFGLEMKQSDEVLIFMVNYHFSVWKPKEKDVMMGDVRVERRSK